MPKLRTTLGQLAKLPAERKTRPTSDYVCATYRRRKANGLCTTCGGLRGNSSSTADCSACLTAKRKDRRAARTEIRKLWRETGCCQACGAVLDRNGARCNRCLLQQRSRSVSRATERAAAGLCYRCSSKLTENGYDVCLGAAYPQCGKCYFRNMAKLHLGSADRWTVLSGLFKRQHGRCAYTGENLVLGLTASLDHIVPISKGGRSVASNLQWVTKIVNHAKNNMDHVEFVSMCKRVAENH